MKNKQFWVTLTLLVMIILSVILAQVKQTFSIKKVSCSIDTTDECPDYIQAELNKNIGKSFFQVDLAKQLQKMSTYQPSLHQYQFKQQLPDTLQVKFTMANEAYAVRSATSDTKLIVDETGTVINQSQNTTLPTIEIPDQLFQSLAVRSTIQTEIHQGLVSLTTELLNKHISVKKITLTSAEEITLELDDQKVAQLSIRDAALAVDKLSYILENMSAKAVKQPIKSIDLRFKYPVLKT